MIEMCWASQQDKNEIIDFCDYIFSKAHRPHDFQTLLPKLYGENSDSIPHHFIIREDGRITSAILAYPVEMHIGKHSFMTIGVGSVSVHPRSKGHGYMNHLLNAVDEHARELGAVFSILGGQRQRYGYFGYQPAGYQMSCTLSERNVKHALSHICDDGIDIIPMTQAHVSEAITLHESQLVYALRKPDSFIDIAKSWYYIPFAILKDQKMIGFAVLKSEQDCVLVSEIQLYNESNLPSVLKRLSGIYGTVKLTVGAWQNERARYMTDICEVWQIARDHMYKVYREDDLRGILEDAGLSANRSITFDGFELPLPLFVSTPDTV